jgi:hypothetical protein
MMASRLDSADQEKPPSYLLLVPVPVPVLLLLFFFFLFFTNTTSAAFPASANREPRDRFQFFSLQKAPKPYLPNPTKQISLLKNKSQPRQSATKESLRVRAVALFSLHLLMLNSALSSLSIARAHALSLSRKSSGTSSSSSSRNLTIARV